MIIRSQDKKGIVNFANIDVVKLNEIQISISNDCWDFDISYYNSNGNVELLGEYSTKEKAIKVLDMIEDAYRSMSFTDGAVFRMPDDEDVEVLDMRNTELKPCPFCGVEAIKSAFSWGNISDEYTIQCTVCKVRTTVSKSEEAIKLWNRRV